MKKMLKRCGLKFVALNLYEHWSTPRNETSGTLNEIEAWLHLQAWKEAPAYVILDDHASAGGLSGSWLEDKTVFGEAWVGFSDAKLTAAREILLSQCK